MVLIRFLIAINKLFPLLVFTLATPSPIHTHTAQTHRHDLRKLNKQNPQKKKEEQNG